MSDAILQLATIPLLLSSLYALSQHRLRHQRTALLFVSALVLVPVLQLIPLPSFVWTSLPGRSVVVETYELLASPMPWRPITLSANTTALSTLSLIPPLSIFLGCVLLSVEQRRSLSLVVLAFGVVSVFLGLLQFAQGPQSPLRFFAETNPTESVGFFANRNHFAALLTTLTAFAAVWAIEKTLSFRTVSRRRRRRSTASIEVVAAYLTLVLIVAAQSIARSRAGLILEIAALFLAMALAYTDRRTIAAGVNATKAIALISLFAVISASQFALYRIMERFAADPLEDARIPLARNTIEAAKAYFPFGSGVGTFVPVYALFEKPEDTFQAYANRAHNDLLEVWLESGAVGLILMALFLAWLVQRSIAVWRPSAQENAHPLDIALSKAATAILVLLILHSLVDYPLRTAALQAIAAVACALLVAPVCETVGVSHSDTSTDKGQKIPSEGRSAMSGSFPNTQEAQSPHASLSDFAPELSKEVRPRERWGESISWPEAWRNNQQTDAKADASKPTAASAPTPKTKI